MTSWHQYHTGCKMFWSMFLGTPKQGIQGVDVCQDLPMRTTYWVIWGSLSLSISLLPPPDQPPPTFFFSCRLLKVNLPSPRRKPVMSLLKMFPRRKTGTHLLVGEYEGTQMSLFYMVKERVWHPFDCLLSPLRTFLVSYSGEYYINSRCLDGLNCWRITGLISPPPPIFLSPSLCPPPSLYLSLFPSVTHLHGVCILKELLSLRNLPKGLVLIFSLF